MDSYIRQLSHNIPPDNIWTQLKSKFILNKNVMENDVLSSVHKLSTRIFDTQHAIANLQDLHLNNRYLNIKNIIMGLTPKSDSQLTIDSSKDTITSHSDNKQTNSTTEESQQINLFNLHLLQDNQAPIVGTVINNQIQQGSAPSTQKRSAKGAQRKSNRSSSKRKRGKSSPTDIQARLCHSVCNMCADVLSLRWATLCYVECESGAEGPTLRACMTLWSVKEKGEEEIATLLRG